MKANISISAVFAHLPEEVIALFTAFAHRVGACCAVLVDVGALRLVLDARAIQISIKTINARITLSNTSSINAISAIVKAVGFANVLRRKTANETRFFCCEAQAVFTSQTFGGAATFATLKFGAIGFVTGR